MKIIKLRSYSQGYTGIIEENDKYVFFTLSKKGKIKKLINYHKADYPSYEHFVGVIGRFAPPSSFLKEPLYVQSLTMDELNRVYLETKHGRRVRKVRNFKVE